MDPARKPNVLFLLPPGWDALSKTLFGHEAFNSFLHGTDHYAVQQIDYFVGFRPPHGFLKTLPRLKAIFSLGAGVDGFLRDPEFPRHLPVVRFVDETLQREMAQYVVMHSLIIHRHQRGFDAAQKDHAWRQRMLARPSREVRIGILGMGDIGAVTAERLLMLDFQRSLQFQDGDKAKATVEEVMRRFPTTEHRCHNLALEKANQYELPI